MLAARHRARLAMQDGNADSREDFPARILKNPKVRRKLFADEEGTEESEERRGFNDNQTNEFTEEHRRHLEEARKKYNFNFETETPEPGKYIWEKVNKDENEVPKEEMINGEKTESHKSQENNEEADQPSQSD